MTGVKGLLRGSTHGGSGVLDTGRMSAAVAWQRVWDDAALLAHRGVPLEEIVTRMLDNSSPDVAEHVAAQVPIHGRTFWVSMIKTLLAACVIVTLLLLIRSFARPIPGFTAVICALVAIAAVAIGTMAGHQRVRNRRQRILSSDRTAVGRIADEAARAVWQSEVPGRWAPAGPEPREDMPRASLGTAWMRRWGADGPAPEVVVADHAAAAVQSLTVSNPVLFVGDQALDDETRSAADRLELAVFSFARTPVTPLSAAAEAIWAAYRSPTTIRPPAELIEQPAEGRH